MAEASLTVAGYLSALALIIVYFIWENGTPSANCPTKEITAPPPTPHP